MLVYLYNHDVNEIEEDLPYLKKEEERISKDVKYSAYKDNVAMIRYCEHCNSTLVGYWEYVHFHIPLHRWNEYDRKKFEGRILEWPLDNEVKEIDEVRYCDKNKLYIEARKQYNIDDFCYNLIPCKSGEILRFEFDEQKKRDLKPLLTISPKIIQYRKEMGDFFSMDTCPICNKNLERHPNRHIYFTGPIYLYENLQYLYPENMFEEHTSGKWFKTSDIPEDICELPKGETFVYNNRLAIKDGISSNRCHIQYYNKSSLDSMLRYFNYFLKDKFNEPATQKIKEITEKFNVIPVRKALDKNSFDTEGLRNYLNHICQLEGNIFSVTERLKTLYVAHFESKKDALASQILFSMALKNKLAEVKEVYTETKRIEPKDIVIIDDFMFDYPEKPIVPTMPSQPTLKTAGLFNKKKIEAENNLLTQEYQAKLATYNVKMELYSEELKKYNRKVDELEQNQQEMYSAKIAEEQKNKQDKLDSLKEKIKDLEKEIEEFENVDSDIVTPEKIKNELIETEIKEAEKLLCETYKALNELYSYDIIFGKYRNFVAVSTFYEYLSSGRCVTLEGADGAYNIYESEIRANQMISQLSQVIDSLDKIQQNQYVICSAIQESNRNLAQLNRSMNSAVSALNDINVTTKNMNSTMEKISEHAAVAAYNSSVAAYYSKKNAELTNALGYLIALS